MNIKKKYKRGNLAKCNIPIKTEIGKNITNLTNQKFVRLLVIKAIGTNYQKSAVWECLCDCGNKVNVPSTHLMGGHTTSCGCIRNEHLLKMQSNNTKADSGYLSLFNKYKYAALKRKLEFDLNPDEFKDIVLKNCYYCNSIPKNTHKVSSKKKIVYNGIDRIENHIGYKTDNVLPCCIACNRMKSDMDIFEFSEYISSLVKHAKTWIKGL